MDDTRPSTTALAAAFYRARHHLRDAPHVFDDPLAHRLLRDDETAAITRRRLDEARAHGIDGATDDEILDRALRVLTPAASVLSRARYAEERLEAAVARDVAQYVIVGAGLDTFALRRPDLAARLATFELDHPRSQALKRERLSAAGLACPPGLHFGSVDFERESVADALRRLPFRVDRPALFAWLGVTMYLTRDAIAATWHALREVAAPGSELVLDFLWRTPGTPETPGGRELLARTRAAGEPIISALDPDALPAALAAAGWTLVEHLDPAAIERRWFATRADGLHARPASHLAAAVVA